MMRTVFLKRRYRCLKLLGNFVMLKSSENDVATQLFHSMKGIESVKRLNSDEFSI